MSNIACVRVFVPIVTVGSCTSAGAATAKSRSITTGGTGASSTVTFGVEDGAGALAAVFKARAASTSSSAWISPWSEPSPSWRSHPENDSHAAARRSRSAGLASRFSSSHRFMSCSISQATSPRSIRPTMRPLPFSVWKPRRMVVSDSRSSGCLRHTGSVASMRCSTSAASSRKIARSSASTSGRGAGAAGSGRRSASSSLIVTSAWICVSTASTRLLKRREKRASGRALGSLEFDLHTGVALRVARLDAFAEALEEEIERLVARLAPLHAGIEVEADPGEALGHPGHALAPLLGRRDAARGDHVLADRHGFGRALERQHLERAVHLAQVRAQAVEPLALGGVAGERIEHLL